MPTPAATTSIPKPTFALGGLFVALGTGIGVGVAIGLLIARLAGWETGGQGARAAPLALGAWSVTGVFGALLLASVTRRQIQNLGLPVLLIGFFRMLTATGLGLGGYLLLKPAANAYWTCFLAAGLCCLASETLWAVRQLAQLDPDRR